MAHRDEFVIKQLEVCKKTFMLQLIVLIFSKWVMILYQWLFDMIDLEIKHLYLFDNDLVTVEFMNGSAQ